MIEFHRKMLGDKVRNDAFYQALKRVIVPGKTVVADVGSGTGFLGFLALKLGAKECIFYEVGEVMEIARALAKENHIKNCRFIALHSAKVKDPPLADVVVSETLGNFALEENILETLNDSKRFLHKGGAIIPASLKQCVAPITSPRLWKEIDVWRDVGFDLSFEAMREVALQNMYVKQVKAEDLLGKGSGREFDHIDFSAKNKSIREHEVSWKIEKKSTIYGFTVWWDSCLTGDIHLSTSPFSPLTHWEQIVLTVMEPISVESGHTLRLRLKSDSRYSVKIRLIWDVTIVDGKGKAVSQQKLDTRKGLEY